MGYCLLPPDLGLCPSGLDLQQTTGTVDGPRGPPAPPRPHQGLPHFCADFTFVITETHVGYFFFEPLFTALAAPRLK